MAILAPISLNVIALSGAVAVGIAFALLAVDLLAWVVAGIFDRERLTTGARS
ncbi:MAG: hypothetical protein ACRDVP_07485 [Acidimicrobiales bacterium]